MSLPYYHHPRRSLHNKSSGGNGAIFADGTVRRSGGFVPPQTLRALTTINGGERVDMSGFEYEAMLGRSVYYFPASSDLDEITWGWSRRPIASNR